jgi:predicted ATP-dependent endonuclease of OLD family
MASARIQRFRCLYDVTVEFDSLTVMIGANGSGKSSVLHALSWFFAGGALDPEDLSGCDPDATVSVSVTFSDLSDADRKVLESYGTGETATFWRTWSLQDGMKLTGRGVAFPPFEAIRAITGQVDLRKAYTEYRASNDGLGLPPVTSGPLAIAAMKEWETKNSGLLQTATTSATHLFGFVGGPRLAGRFDFVFVPAVLDADQQTHDARGTLLARLLERSTANRGRIDERFSKLNEDVSSQILEIFEEEHKGALRQLSDRVTAALQTYIEDASISLQMRPPEFKVPALGVDMRVADGGVETDVGRQGNGFQRALLIATLQELALVETEDVPPGIFLAIEEPELYQHPAQARHFERVLAELAHHEERVIQVALATHSPYFIDPGQYVRLRRFRKHRGPVEYPTTEVTSATIEGVAKRLTGIVDETEVARRMNITLRRTLSEAVFAQAVLVVEGVSDSALLAGIADRDGGFDGIGVAIVQTNGKTLIPIVWTILAELGIPTYTVFDGDRGIEARMRLAGKAEGDIRDAATETVRRNRMLLRLLGASEEDWPDTHADATYAVFGDTPEAEFEANWSAMMAMARALAIQEGDKRDKPEDAYRQAAREVPGEVPEFGRRVVQGVKALR